MLSSSQIAGSVIINIPGRNACISLGFLQVDIYEGKVTSETTFSWACSGMPSQAQTCLELPTAPSGSLGDIALMKLGSHTSKFLLKGLRKNKFFIKVLSKFQFTC